MDETLAERRRRLDAVRVGRAAPDGLVATDVIASWQRCEPVVGDLGAAPTLADDEVASRWDESRIRLAGAAVLDELAGVADAGDYLAAITDAEGTILWCHGGRSMRRLGEAVNFVRGGRWGEADAGTNALGLALTSARPASVFSSEHWVEAVTDWVCYSAPVLDPLTGVPLGVIDLSATWDRSSALGLTTVTALARLVSAELFRAPAGSPEWQLRLLGRSELLHHGVAVPLTARQTEILAVIALSDGVTLDELHAHVYGDRPVSMATLKAEISHLRKRVGDLLASRPYRLTRPVSVDVDEVLAAAGRGDVSAALEWYRGPLLPLSEAPMLVDRGHHLESVLMAVLERAGTVQDRLAYTRHHPGVLDV